MTGGAAIIIWILVFFGIFYFLAIRPQRRQRQAHQDLVTMLKKGDEVVTIGGVFGKVTAIGDDWVELEIAKRTRVRFLKRAVSSITSIEEDEDEEYIEAADEEYIEAADEDVVEEAADAAPDEAEDLADEDVVEEAADEAPDAPPPPEAPRA
jgi:preprotein translocase subunit YajC